MSLITVSKIRAQEVDPRVVEVYGSSFLEKLEHTSPMRISYLNYYVKHGFRIVPLQTGKQSEIAGIETVSIIRTGKSAATLDWSSEETINILQLDIKRGMDQRLFYALSDDRMLVLLSPNEVLEAFKAEQP